jgi:hypothetical protein
MSTTTATLGLIKPELTDAADITATNANWDKIDSKFQEFGNVDNTPDIEKKVAYADEAGAAKKTVGNLILQFNGGNTENTDKFTYDASSNKSINITPEGIGASANGHEHSFNRGVVTSGNGSAYTAEVEGITELTAGLSFIMIPHVVSNTTTPTLNVNGLGVKNIRQPLSTNTSATTTAESASWLVANKPVRVMYDGTQWKVDITRPSATNLYGTVQVEKGGTGGTTVEDAQSNLGLSKVLTCELVKTFYNSTLKFEEQTVVLDINKNVLLYLINFRQVGTNSDSNFTDIFIPGQITTVSRVRGGGTNSCSDVLSRRIKVEDNGTITFYEAYKNGSVDNSVITPEKIYAVTTLI